MMDHTDCLDCAGSGEICTGCWAPADWCGCEQGDAAPRTIACKRCCEEQTDLPLVAAA